MKNLEAVLKEQELEYIEQQNRNDEEAGWQGFIANFPQYNCQANRQMLIDFCEPMTATLATIMSALPHISERLATLSDARVEKNLEQQAADQQAADEAAAIAATEAQRAEIRRMKGLSKQELRAEIESRKPVYLPKPFVVNHTRAELLNMSARELRNLMHVRGTSQRIPGAAEAIEMILNNKETV